MTNFKHTFGELREIVFDMNNGYFGWRSHFRREEAYCKALEWVTGCEDKILKELRFDFIHAFEKEFNNFLIA